MSYRHNSYIHGRMIPAHAQWVREMGLDANIAAGLLGVSERAVKDAIAFRTFKTIVPKREDYVVDDNLKFYINRREGEPE